MNAAEITDKLGLHSLRQRSWVRRSPHYHTPHHRRTIWLTHQQYIQSTCATSGEGLYEGLEWVADQLKKTG